MIRVVPRLAILLIAAVGLLAVLAARDEVDAVGRPPLAVISLEGDTAPGTNGATFANCLGDVSTHDEPMVNAAGTVLFWGCLSNGGWGLFLKVFGDPMTAIAVSSQNIPGVGELPSSSADLDLTDGPGLNNRETSIFSIQGGITGSDAPDSVLFMKKRNRDLETLLRTGDSSPCGGTFRIFDDMSINNKDDIAFIATYDDGTRKAGVFLRLADGTLEKVLCNGDSLPGTGTPNEKFTGVDFDGADGPWLNDNQMVAFQTDAVSGPTFDQDGDMLSIWDGSVFAKQRGENIEPFLLRGDDIPSTVGDGVVDGIAMARPALNNDNQIGFMLERDTSTQAHPGMIFVASKKLGQPMEICLEPGDPVSGGTFEEPSAVAINQKGDLQFSAEIDTDPNHEDPNNNEADNIRGVLTCRNGTVSSMVLETDNNKPRGSWSHELEEGSIGGPFVVFDDEVNYSGPSSERGVFLSSAQEDPIQGNFLCQDGHVDDLDILQLLKFKAGVPGITSAGVNVCPSLGQLEARSGFQWGDVNCDGNVDLNDILFMLADRAGVPKTAQTVNCYQIGEVITG